MYNVPLSASGSTIYQNRSKHKKGVTPWLRKKVKGSLERRVAEMMKSTTGKHESDPDRQYDQWVHCQAIDPKLGSIRGSSHLDMLIRQIDKRERVQWLPFYADFPKKRRKRIQ